MNVIDYITITCNLKNIRLHEKCNRLQPITITNYDYPMSVGETRPDLGSIIFKCNRLHYNYFAIFIITLPYDYINFQM